MNIAMAYMCYIVLCIQVAIALLIDEKLAFASNSKKWIV